MEHSQRHGGCCCSDQHPATTESISIYAVVRVCACGGRPPCLCDSSAFPAGAHQQRPRTTTTTNNNNHNNKKKGRNPHTHFSPLTHSLTHVDHSLTTTTTTAHSQPQSHNNHSDRTRLSHTYTHTHLHAHELGLTATLRLTLTFTTSLSLSLNLSLTIVLSNPVVSRLRALCMRSCVRALFEVLLVET